MNDPMSARPRSDETLKSYLEELETIRAEKMKIYEIDEELHKTRVTMASHMAELDRLMAQEQQLNNKKEEQVQYVKELERKRWCLAGDRE